MKNVELLNIYHLYGKPELNWAVINWKLDDKENTAWRIRDDYIFIVQMKQSCYQN
jgi:hypothetical protein